MKQHEMINLSDKEMKHIKNSLKHGDNKIIALKLGIKSPAFSRYLKAIPTYNPKTRKFDFGYRMPNKVYNAITNFINSK